MFSIYFFTVWSWQKNLWVWLKFRWMNGERKEKCIVKLSVWFFFSVVCCCCCSVHNVFLIFIWFGVLFPHAHAHNTLNKLIIGQATCLELIHDLGFCWLCIWLLGFCFLTLLLSFHGQIVLFSVLCSQHKSTPKLPTFPSVGKYVFILL